MPRDESLFPVDQRIYFQTLFGNRDAISEKDFSARELKAIKEAVKANMARTGGQTKGNVKYEDYPDAAQATPGYAPIESTLGRFNYRVNPDKSITATDRYDFLNDERQANVQRFEQMSPMRRAIQAPVEAMGQFFTGRPRTAFGTLGEAFIGRDGREVKVEIPPGYADGGSVKSLADYFKANVPVPMHEGEGAQLRNRFPQIYGGLAGLLGTPPDEMAGSVLEPGYADRKAGADKTFALGTLLQMLPMAPATKGMPVGAVIRNVGDNNFLNGSVENALKGLKKKGFTREAAIQKRTERLIALGTPEKNRIPGMDTYGNPISDQELARELEVNRMLSPRINSQLLTTADVASNKFVEGPLTRYVKQQMATPEDPIRALAEQGVLHFDAGITPTAATRAGALRGRAGFAPLGEGKSDLARAWEATSDANIDAYKAKQFQGDALVDNPWLATKPPETNVYGMDVLNPTATADRLGFTHLTDELRNALNPESGLPRNLLLTPEKMANMGMEKAVRHVAAINDWREQAALTARKAAAEGIPVRKEHEGGFRWLSVPDTAKDEKALKFACDIGKQGAWCTQGADAAKLYGSDGNQLHVLVDAKGNPHVQIHTEPDDKRAIFDRLVTAGWQPGEVQLLDEHEKTLEAAASKMDFEFNPRYASYTSKSTGQPLSYEQDVVPQIREVLKSKLGNDYEALASRDYAPPDRIVQIKRKANLVNSEPYEYRPFVQDFVKSGKWSDVGDYANTGLRHGQREFTPAALENLSARGIDATGHMTPEEYEAALGFVPESALSPQQLRKLKGFAQGGRVSMIHPAAAIQPLVRVPGFDRF